MYPKCFWIYVFGFLVAHKFQASAMTREQIKNSGKLLKKSCLQKNPVTEQQLQMIVKGNFEENRDVMCFLACLYTMSQGVKNNKLSIDSMIKQVQTMFPEDMKKTSMAVLEECRSVPKKYKDLCESSFWFTKCVHDADPPNFLFV